MRKYIRPLASGLLLQFKAAKQAKEIEGLAQAHGLAPESLTAFVDTILQRMIFDGEQLTDLMAPLDLGWRKRRERELALMTDLIPLLNKRITLEFNGKNPASAGSGDTFREGKWRSDWVSNSR